MIPLLFIFIFVLLGEGNLEISTANNERLSRTISEEYRSLVIMVTPVMDLKALVTACEDVCKKIAEPASRLPRTNYAAVH